MTTIPEISLKGFQVVSKDMFVSRPRQGKATCTLWNNSIGFSVPAYRLLNGCETILIQVNTIKKMIIIMPAPSTDKDAIRWTSNSKKNTLRKLKCSGLTEELFRLWELDPEMRYFTAGKVVSAEQKIMLLFDFNQAEHSKRRDAAAKHLPVPEDEL